ncbi:MAG: hypothetical protein EHM28_07495 [Spirochaetaceae bacterium]|nr:MAG: hypothetical protein EHM28_07495 [Spirochaetaceae bacterium]
MRYKILLALFLFVTGTVIFGNGKVLVAQVSGTGATLIRNGSSEFFSFSEKNPKGMELLAGDILNLEPDSMMELVILPVNSRLQASESTSFRIRAVSEAGGYDVELYYGKLRAFAISGIRLAPFSINNMVVVPQEESADFGYDVYTDVGAKGSSQQIYCFSGEVTVSRSNSSFSSTGGTESVRLLPMEMARIRELGRDIPLAKIALGTGSAKAWLGEAVVAELSETAGATQPVTTVEAPGKTESSVTTPSVVTNISKPEGDAKTASSTQQNLTPAAKTDETSATATVTEDKVSATETAPECARVTTTVRDTGESTLQTNPEGTIPATAEKKDTPVADTKAATAAAETDQVKTAQQNNGGDVPVAFKLDMNMEFIYMLHESPTIPPIPGFDLFVHLVDTLAHMRFGLLIDPAVMFVNVIGFGLETGAMYAPYFDGTDIIHTFTIPASVFLRLTIGPVFFQIKGGMLFDGVLNQTTSDFVISDVFRYEAGVRLGIKLGNSAFYASGILISDTIDGFFNEDYYTWVGVGVIFSIF